MTRDRSHLEVVDQANGARLEGGIAMQVIGERAIRAGDFAGLVPASRGADCRPLHLQLAALCSPGKKDETDPRLGRRPGSGRSNVNR